MSYRVLVTPTTRAQIFEQARYIAVDRQAPLNAARWLEQVFTATDTLADFPRRCPLAPENDFRDYEIRRLLIGDYFLLFTVVDGDQTVWAIGFRHGSRLPRPDELPGGIPNEES
jgi:plasmid stabilization system protein ParE